MHLCISEICTLIYDKNARLGFYEIFAEYVRTLHDRSIYYLHLTYNKEYKCYENRKTIIEFTYSWYNRVFISYSIICVMKKFPLFIGMKN